MLKRDINVTELHSSSVNLYHFQFFLQTTDWISTRGGGGELTSIIFKGYIYRRATGMGYVFKASKWMGIIFTSKVYQWGIFFTQKVYEWVKFEKKYM